MRWITRTKPPVKSRFAIFPKTLRINGTSYVVWLEPYYYYEELEDFTTNGLRVLDVVKRYFFDKKSAEDSFYDNAY